MIALTSLLLANAAAGCRGDLGDSADPDRCALGDENLAGDGAAGNGWQRAVREAFLRGYFRDSAAGDHGILPASRPNADRLITLFETEKIFYELQYELDHRPEWVWIPLSGIAKLAT